MTVKPRLCWFVLVVCCFRCFLRSFQIPVLCPGSVWQHTLLCCLWCQAAGPPKPSRRQAPKREKRLLCDWINFWAPHCLINENDPGAESETIVCAVTKSLPINSILNRISQAFLICWLRPLQKGPGSWNVVFPLQSQNFKHYPLGSAMWMTSWTLTGFCSWK